MYPRILFNWLAPPLRHLEQRILTAIEANLPPAVQVKFQEQRRRINYVQRREGGREVALYAIKGGRVTHDPTISVPVAGRETRLARVRLHKDAEKHSATVYLVDGYLSSIEFDRPPLNLDHDADIEVTIFALPSTEPKSVESQPRLPEWLQVYANELGMSSIEPPLVKADRVKLIDELEVSLPADYLEFLEGCDGAVIGSLSLMGIAEAYRSIAGEKELVVIGQLDGRALIAVQRPGPEVVVVRFESDELQLGELLRNAVEFLLSRT